MSGLKGILGTRDKGLKVEMIKAKVVPKWSQDVGHVVNWGIGQRIQCAKQSQGPSMKVHQRKLDLTRNQAMTTANQNQQGKYASSTKIRGSASLGRNASSFMIRITDLTYRG